MTRLNASMCKIVDEVSTSIQYRDDKLMPNEKQLKNLKDVTVYMTWDIIRVGKKEMDSSL